MSKNLQTAFFGGGCFWCAEAVFENIRGVICVIPGYAGGHLKNPTYEQVSGGKTGHAEVVKIEFDPQQISYKDLLTVFFATHDPTKINRQGNDIGEQYRSIILYANEEQKNQAQNFIKELNMIDGKPVVTEVKPLEQFYESEEYHRQYYRKNPKQTYCQLIINLKLEKMRKDFEKLLKK